MTKEELRAEVKKRRAALFSGASELRASAVAINAVQLLRDHGIEKGAVAAFASIVGEPPTDVLLTALTELGYELYLPRVVDDENLSWVKYEGLLESDLLGIPTPSGEATTSPAEMAAIFVPAVAASPDGRRLGRGRGYYDRALAGVPKYADGGPLLIGVVDQAGWLPSGVIEMNDNDRWLDIVFVG